MSCCLFAERIFRWSILLSTCDVISVPSQIRHDEIWRHLFVRKFCTSHPKFENIWSAVKMLFYWSNSDWRLIGDAKNSWEYSSKTWTKLKIKRKQKCLFCLLPAKRTQPLHYVIVLFTRMHYTILLGSFLFYDVRQEETAFLFILFHARSLPQLSNLLIKYFCR